jgi:DNA-binding XRE family transcriptional regulator
MLVVVKTPHIEARGELAKSTIEHFIKKYGKRNVEVIDDDTEDVFKTDWFKKISANDSPGKTLRVYRTRDGMSQAELAKRLGIFKQHVSNMENGSRAISQEMAKQLGELFGISYKRFL